MRQFCTAMVGVALLVLVTGCGGDTGAAPGSGFLDDASNSGVPFKSTDMSQFESMKSQTQDIMKNKSYTKKPAPPKEKDKAEKAKS